MDHIPLKTLHHGVTLGADTLSWNSPGWPWVWTARERDRGNGVGVPEPAPLTVLRQENEAEGRWVSGMCVYVCVCWAVGWTRQREETWKR